MLELESRMGDGKRARRPAPRELARARDQRTTVHVYRGAGAGPEVSAPSTAPAAAEERGAAPSAWRSSSQGRRCGPSGAPTPSTRAASTAGSRTGTSAPSAGCPWTPLAEPSRCRRRGTNYTSA
ncbi:unnamed protein product [Prorocentrum cordatum]|uniref:Uncharacterized protein n=1 Tax=Prorocentrum cordatum TaxID=2364126 RepID=A0ABN9SDZ9_9DINO|nr:unnamed protein product [Polarella glacialis]